PPRSTLFPYTTLFRSNTVRKHIAAIKGGGLARHLFPAKIVTLIPSDIVTNDLSMVASGLASRDTTTVADAKRILKKYNIKTAGRSEEHTSELQSRRDI